jgi:hypothetical protein
MSDTSPTSAPAFADDTWINRVSALLAKAESTEYSEEAEALVAKAQQLMARHAIDEALLASKGGATTDEVVTDTIVIEPPYASAKSSLLGAVAAANNSRCVRVSAGAGAQRCVVVGYESDLANVRTLYGSLVMHAVRSMLATDVPPGDSARAFRHAFLLSYAGRVSERLRAANAAARREATEADPQAAGSGVDVVLASREREVELAFQREFPNTRTARATSSSRAGHQSGRRAADRAGLGQRSVGARLRGLPSG